MIVNGYDIEVRGIRGWTNAGDEGGFVVEWAAKGVGFGELSVWYDGSVRVDDECMSPEFVEAVLLVLARSCRR